MEIPNLMLIGYAVPLESTKNILREKLPLQIDIDLSDVNEDVLKVEKASFFLFPILVRPGLADNPNHILVKTDSKQILLNNVKKTTPQGLSLITLVSHLKYYGYEYYTLEEYVSKEVYNH